jgi:hypothetical protein
LRKLSLVFSTAANFFPHVMRTKAGIISAQGGPVEKRILRNQLLALFLGHRGARRPRAATDSSHEGSPAEIAVLLGGSLRSTSGTRREISSL